MTTTRLIIARHGNTFGPGDVVRRVGITDLPLVASGLAQGHALGVYLKQRDMMPRVIFTSMLRRAKETAEAAQLAMQSDIPLHALSMFNEIDYGPDENQPETLVAARIGESALRAWDSEARVPPGWQVEPTLLIHHWQTFAADLCRDYAGQTVLVVSSNGIIRFAPHLTADFAAHIKRFPLKVATGALSVLEHREGATSWNCCEWNTKLG